MLKSTMGVWAFVLIIFIGGLTSAAAVTEIEITCPLDGTKFKSPVPVRGVQTGTRLDFKPIGSMEIPVPLPVCPKDHFVMYKNQFTDAEKERLKKFVLSPEYQNLAKENPSYFLLAKIFEYLGETDWQIANAYLLASWQVENKPEKEKQYLELTLQHLNKFLSTGNKEGDRTWETGQLLAGEMERRLGRFDDAKKRFLGLGKLSGFKQGFNAAVLMYQLDLIAKKDSGVHELPPPPKK
jgi:hypothetical protein